MAFMTKEIRWGKDQWAKEHFLKEAKFALEMGMSEDQVNAIGRLTTDRHNIHVHNSSVFCSESGDANTIGYLLMESSGESINDYLRSANLAPINWTYNFEDVPDDSTYELDELTEDEARIKCDEMMEQFDRDMINYLKKIDNEFGTSFCPSGIGRTLGTVRYL